MKQGKDVKKSETPSKDSSFEMFNRDEFFNNRLALPKAIKDKLTSEGKDWRFINAQQFRNEGNVHRSHWRPEKFEASELTNAEGFLQRGDVILATRPKHITAAHKRFIKDRNKRLNLHQTETAKQLRDDIRKAGAEDTIKVSEGYGEED